MVASTKIQNLRELVKEHTADPNFIGVFQSYGSTMGEGSGAAVAAQKIADETGKPTYIHDGRKGFSVWLKRRSKTDSEFRPSEISKRNYWSNLRDVKTLKDSAPLDDKFYSKFHKVAEDALSVGTIEEAEKILDDALGERAKDLYAPLRKIRSEVESGNIEEDFKYSTNEELQRYVITSQIRDARIKEAKQLLDQKMASQPELAHVWHEEYRKNMSTIQNPEKPDSKLGEHLEPSQWTRMAKQGYVRVGGLKDAVRQAIERITLTGKPAKWKKYERPMLITIAKHLERGDWWLLENKTLDNDPRLSKQRDVWEVIETITYNPKAKDPSLAYYRIPNDHRTVRTTWSVEIVTFDGETITRTVGAGDGYSAQKKIQAVLAESGLGGYKVTDVRQADADSFDTVDVDLFECGELDQYEIEFESDFDILESRSSNLSMPTTWA